MFLVFGSVRELQTSITTFLSLRNAQRTGTSGTPRAKTFGTKIQGS